MEKIMGTHLYIVRHGETVWNTQDKMQGVKDSPLTDKGKIHAGRMGEKLNELGIDFSALYSSDLGRAYETSKLINKPLGLEIKADDRLRERNMGVFEGHSWDYVRANYEDDFKMLVSDDDSYKIPDGESRAAYRDKVISFLEYIAEKHTGENVLAVTHRGFINFMLRIILNIPLNARSGLRINNASLSVLTIYKNRWLLEKFGDI
jgi:probable phosphoglycerate mutase